MPGLVHGGWGHRLFNMLTLCFFGRVVKFQQKYKKNVTFAPAKKLFS